MALLKLSSTSSNNTTTTNNNNYDNISPLSSSSPSPAEWVESPRSGDSASRPRRSLLSSHFKVQDRLQDRKMKEETRDEEKAPNQDLIQELRYEKEEGGKYNVKGKQYLVQNLRNKEEEDQETNDFEKHDGDCSPAKICNADTVDHGEGDYVIRSCRKSVSVAVHGYGDVGDASSPKIEASDEACLKSRGEEAGENVESDFVIFSCRKGPRSRRLSVDHNYDITIKGEASSPRPDSDPANAGYVTKPCTETEDPSESSFLVRSCRKSSRWSTFESDDAKSKEPLSPANACAASDDDDCVKPFFAENNHGDSSFVLRSSPEDDESYGDSRDNRYTSSPQPASAENLSAEKYVQGDVEPSQQQESINTEQDDRNQLHLHQKDGEGTGQSNLRSDDEDVEFSWSLRGRTSSRKQSSRSPSPSPSRTGLSLSMYDRDAELGSPSSPVIRRKDMQGTPPPYLAELEDILDRDISSPSPNMRTSGPKSGLHIMLDNVDTLLESDAENRSEPRTPPDVVTYSRPVTPVAPKKNRKSRVVPMGKQRPRRLQFEDDATDSREPSPN